MPPVQFWDLTPREVHAAMTGARDRDYRRSRELQAMTYTLAQLVAAAMHNPKKMPDFDKAFPDARRPRRRKTVEEMRQAMRAWAASFGVNGER